MRTITLIIAVLLLATTSVAQARDGKTWDSKSHFTKSSWRDYKRDDNKHHGKKRYDKKRYDKKRYGKKKEAFAKKVSAIKETRAQARKVCDPLLASDSELYGLCVSYCQVKDMGTVFTRGKLNPERAEKIARRKEGLLARYNEKKGASDPSMPCISTNNVCPCWTSNQASASVWMNKPVGAACVSQDVPTFKTDELSTNTDTVHPSYASLKALRMSQDGVKFTNYCTNEEMATSTSVIQEISDTDFLTCGTQIQATCGVMP